MAFEIKKLINFIVVSFMIAIMLSGCTQKENLPSLSNSEYERVKLLQNEYENLCVPTQMNKIGDEYYIVDCYHNQVILSKDKNKSVKDWSVLSNKINMGHTICSDEVVYLIDDTEDNSVLVYAKQDDDFYYLNELKGVGKRPHFILYNSKNELFYVLSSLTGEFYLYKREKDSYDVKLEKVVKIPQLDGVYVRSFSFIDGLIYLPAGNGFLYEIDPNTFAIISFQELPPELGGPTQITKFGDYYYLTVSTDIFANPSFATFVRTKDTNNFIKGEYEVLKDKFCDEGTPYVLNEIDDTIYLAWHSEDGKNCMWSFKIDKNNDLTDIVRVFE